MAEGAPGIQVSKEKEALEINKLALEARVLRRQLSIWGVGIQVLSSVSGIAAIIAALIAYSIGSDQIKQSEHLRRTDRFERSLGRLSSARLEDRLSGVAGLQQFLTDDDKKLRTDALQYLINAISIETDRRIQDTILDVISDIDTSKIERETLNNGLKVVIERNRMLTNRIVSGFATRRQEEEMKALGYNSGHPQPGEISKRFISELSFDKYTSLVAAHHGIFENLPEELDVPIHGLANAISALLRLGARQFDFDAIFCEGCDFSVAKVLTRASFKGAHLSGAIFNHVILIDASFQDADLDGASFYNSDLTNANLRASTTRRPQRLPILECSILSGADLTGLPLVKTTHVYDEEAPTGSVRKIEAVGLKNTTVDSHTKLDYMTVLHEMWIFDFLMLESTDEEKRASLRRYMQSSTFPSPLIKDMYSQPEIRRGVMEWFFRFPDYLYTKLYMVTAVNNYVARANVMPSDADILIPYLVRSSLTKLPLVLNIVDSLKPLNASPNGQSLLNGQKPEAPEKYIAPSCSPDIKPQGPEAIFASNAMQFHLQPEKLQIRQ